MSIDAASNKAEDIMDVNSDTVAQTMADAGVSRLIHGHTHRPARHLLDQGERVVLGDWSPTAGWCVRVTDNAISLETFTL
jgi:UDP-2,3-diacylglucosamine hydrolase